MIIGILCLIVAVLLMLDFLFYTLLEDEEHEPSSN